MLFDLDDYKNSGILGADWENIMDLIDNGVSVSNGWETVIRNGGDFADWATTQRATRDAYLKAVNEYFLASKVMRPDILADFDEWFVRWNDALYVWGPSSYYFWSAFQSIPYLGGRNGGEAAFNNNSDFPGGFRVMTQEIYDAYYSNYVILGSLIKELIEMAEGSTIVTL